MFSGNVFVPLVIILNVLICDIWAMDVCSNNNASDVPSYDAMKENTENCGCEFSKCVRKCCKFGYYLKKKICYRSAAVGFKIPVFADRTDFLADYESTNKFMVGIMKCQKFFLLDHSKPKETFNIQADGRLWVSKYSDYYKRDEYHGSYYDTDQYCVDERNGYTAFLCTEEKDPNETIITTVKGVGMIISMPFLALTFLVYLILPDKNIHRKALMFYVLSLLLGYICLVSMQLHTGQIAEALCHILGYCIIFFFLTSFFWMNVMCIDMWLAFSGSRGFMGKRDFERTRFIFYCLYAWGTPTLHILIVYILNTYGDRTSWYHPLVGDRKCFLDDGMPNLLYFYGPIGILTGVNIILFILTTVKIQRVKRETKMLKHSDSRKHSYEDDKQKYILYLKLFFVMGVNWTMEVISWAFLWKMNEVPPAVWYSTDFANAIYGVFIFAIFVCKKKIWNSLKRRYYVFIGKPHLAQAVTTSSQTTRTSHFSTTDSNTNHDQRLQELKNARGEQRALTME